MNLEPLSLRNVVEKAAVQVEGISCCTDNVSIGRRNLHVVEPPKDHLDLLGIFIAKELRQVIQVITQPVRGHKRLTTQAPERMVPPPIYP